MTTQQMIVACLTSSAFTGMVVKLIEALIDKFSKKKEKAREEAKADMEHVKSTVTSIQKDVNEMKEDNLVLLHDRIYSNFKRLAKQDYITSEDRASMDYLFETYTKHGGNHHAEVLYQIICEKPVKPGRKEEE